MIGTLAASRVFSINTSDLNLTVIMISSKLFTYRYSPALLVDVVVAGLVAVVIEVISGLATVVVVAVRELPFKMAMAMPPATQVVTNITNHTINLFMMLLKLMVCNFTLCLGQGRQG